MIKGILMINSTAFSIFGLEVKWYAILITLALIIGSHFAGKIAEKEGFEEDHLLNMLIFAVPCAIIGARAYYVIFNMSEYHSLKEVLNVRAGGLAFHGGFIGAFLCGGFFVKRYKINFFKLADIISPFISLGQAIGRWGNYINGEAHGGVTNLPWAITVNGLKVHPTFFYESFWDFCLFILLYRLLCKKKFDGQIFSIYLIGYSVGRFWIEGLRTDSLMIGNFRIAQLVSIALCFVGAFIFYKLKGEKIKSAYLNYK